MIKPYSRVLGGSRKTVYYNSVSLSVLLLYFLSHHKEQLLSALYIQKMPGTASTQPVK